MTYGMKNKLETVAKSLGEKAALMYTYLEASLRYQVPDDPSRGRAYSPRMEHAIDYKSVLDCGIHQDWTPDS